MYIMDASWLFRLDVYTGVIRGFLDHLVGIESMKIGTDIRL